MDNKWDEIYNEISCSSSEELANAISFLEEKVATLETHIANLIKLSQDYCMCGELVSGHHTSNHAPISEFEWYVKFNKLDSVMRKRVDT